VERFEGRVSLGAADQSSGNSPNWAAFWAANTMANPDGKPRGAATKNFTASSSVWNLPTNKNVGNDKNIHPRLLRDQRIDESPPTAGHQALQDRRFALLC